MSKVLPLTLALLGFGVTPLIAQQVPTVPLGASTASFADPFTNVGGVREVGPGKVIVVDPRDKVAELIDLSSGASTKISREGSGPGEYQFPSTVLPLPNNETLLVDPLQTRLLRIDATGKVVETLSYPTGMGPGMRVRGTDALGRVYFEGSSFGGQGGGLTLGGGPNGGLAAVDSVPVIRWDRRSGKLDSLIMVKGPQLKVNVSGGANSRNVMVRQQPFTSRDGWAVAPDGRVAVARSNPYRVDTRTAGGTRNSGTVIASQALPLTSRDKADFLKGIRNAPRIMRVEGGSGGSGGAAPPAPPAPSAEDYDWPATKPYFDPASVQMSPAGELWSERTRAAGDDIPVYDVFDATGKLARRVTFPAKTRLVGFGAGTIYAVRTDEDDLQYLERYTDCGTRCDSRGVPLGR